jgi:3-oxoacyl-[acyl-carrier-protein] synthase-3
VYSLVVAHGLVLAGAQRILVIGSETLSRITDWDDRSMAVLVGDGAGAVVLEATEGSDELLGWDLGADGSLRHLLKCDTGGYLYMNGKEIFRHAVRAVVDSSTAALARAGLHASDVDLFVPHQANARIISAASQRLGISDERCVVTIDRYGNTSSASIPLALCHALDEDRLTPGATVLLSGFGGGMTWASAVLRWGG